MRDVFGQDLEAGDTVAVIPKNYSDRLVKAKIVKLTPKKVRVEYMNTWNYGKPGRREEYIVSPRCVVKSPHE